MSEKKQKIKAEENNVTQAETIEAKQVSEEKTVQMQSFSEVLREQIHEEETAPASQKLSIIKILGGDFFTSQILRRQILLMIYISIFIIIYISNRYSCQNSMHEIENLKEEYEGRLEIFTGCELDYFSKGLMPLEKFKITETTSSNAIDYSTDIDW